MTSQLSSPTPPTTSARRHADSDLRRWCVEHLPDCERWLVRRRLHRSARAALHVARSGYRPPGATDPVAGQRASDDAWAGVSPAPGTPSSEALTGRLVRDLGPAVEELRAAGLADVRVRTAGGTLVPLLVAETCELVVPSFLVDHLPRELFAPSALFACVRPTSTTWLLFQGLLPVEGHPRTVADHYGVMDYG
jgi:hypothetical protein